MKSINLPPTDIPKTAPSQMSTEAYLNHPTFGLLYRICLLENGQEIFATLYAQRLFFLVSVSTQGFQFEPISRADARLAMENRLRSLRRYGKPEELQQLQFSYKQTFQ